MKVTLRPQAADDLERIYSWIARDNPRAAVAVLRRIRARIDRLSTPGLEQMGRLGRAPDTRELIERPYIIVYRIYEDRAEVDIVAVLHGAQNRE